MTEAIQAEMEEKAMKNICRGSNEWRNGRESDVKEMKEKALEARKIKEEVTEADLK